MVGFLIRAVEEVAFFIEKEGLPTEADDIRITADCDSEVLALFMAIQVLREHDLTYRKSFVAWIYEMAVDNDEEEIAEDCQYLLQKTV
ncbi:hypothetical protein [Alloscardovia criceti]|uniref:hypothetical protein n=1 Tax=Alloscardovia criceti TaxID=356828 RepID=UPI0003613BF5|nr:hypothetical protein [Alloscardovia criceti]